MTGVPTRNYPIAIMAFNRPDYLKQVLDSLLLQQGIDLTNRAITLFQDGHYNQFSQTARAEAADVEASVAVFRDRFPHARVEHSPDNLGVAMNFDRAERWAFEELKSDAAIFLEDDMVLSPYYICTIDRMLDMAMEDPRIGYVGAYGDWNRPMEKQRLAPGKLTRLPQNWAFGLTRYQWVKNQEFMSKYLQFIRGVDYRRRSHKEIYDLYTSYGMSREESSQDRAKLIATVLTGGLRVNITACLAHYIGRVGLHSNEQLYVASGFERTQIYPDGNFEIEKLNHQSYHKLMAEQAAMVEYSSPRLSHKVALTFNVDGNALCGLRQGFYLPESWGVWAGGLDTNISISIQNRSPVKGLWITARHFTSTAGEDIAVQVKANGQLLDTILLQRKQRRVFLPLSENLLGYDGRLDLSFHSPSVSSPASAGVSGDERNLGLGLSMLEIE